MEQRIRVYIVDDYRLFAEAIASLLDAREEISFMGLTVEPEEVLEKAHTIPVDVMLIDANLKTTDAPLLIQNIKKELLNVKMIVIGLEDESETILEFVEAGASGYVLRDVSFDQLLETIKDVYHERTPCSPQIAASAFARIRQLSREQYNQESLQRVSLTPREKHILSLIATGLSNKEIARKLFISISTVKNHVHNLFEKLHVHYRCEAIRYARKSGGLKGNTPQAALVLGAIPFFI
jgi:DNA-binding NarL/FixJ family response regulator